MPRLLPGSGAGARAPPPLPTRLSGRAVGVFFHDEHLVLLARSPDLIGDAVGDQPPHRLAQEHVGAIRVIALHDDLVPPRTVPLGRMVAQQELGEPLVEATPFADLLALEDDRLRRAVDRARQRRLRKPTDAGDQRRLPCDAQAVRVAPRAQVARRAGGHADMTRRLVDAARGGERLDESDLSFGRPAISARAQRDGGEVEGIGGGGARPLGRLLAHQGA